MNVNGNNIPDYYPCPKCYYTWTDPVKVSTDTDYNGRKTITVTYKCRNCGRMFEVEVYKEE